MNEYGKVIIIPNENVLAIGKYEHYKINTLTSSKNNRKR